MIRQATQWRTLGAVAATSALAAVATAQSTSVEVSEDGRTTVKLQPSPADNHGWARGDTAPFGLSPDWQNTLRRQVGALQIADLNNDGLNDLVVGCYISQSYPPYEDWENLIYYNVGGTLEAEPSWVSTDEVSTGDIQVGDIDGDTYPDVFSANGGTSLAPSVIYFGGPDGPSPTPGWHSQTPQATWTNYATLFDLDHDGDLDVVTANQGISPEPFRPMYLFRNEDGALDASPSWQSAESSIQNFLAFADYDHDGWEELAVSKWDNSFRSGIYENSAGSLSANAAWTTGFSDVDMGVAWADVDDNGWTDLMLGHDPTLLFSNDAGVLTQSWSSAAAYFGHSDLRFCDVDGDGDPDFAEVHFSNGQAHLYMNNAGVLDAAPTWTYDSAAVGTAIAFGDIDGDTLADMAIGYSGQPSVLVFYNTGVTPCPGDLNGDLVVDLDDLSIMLINFGQTSGMTYEDGDIDGDGDVDLDDLSELLVSFGGSC